jgi:hypothetical protein
MATKNCSEKSGQSAEEPDLVLPEYDPQDAGGKKLARWNLPLAEVVRLNEEQLLLHPMTEEEFDRRARSKSREKFEL